MHLPIILANLATFLHDGYFLTASDTIPDTVYRTGILPCPDLPNLNHLSALLDDLEVLSLHYGNLSDVPQDLEPFVHSSQLYLAGLHALLTCYYEDPLTFSAIGTLQRSEALQAFLTLNIPEFAKPADWLTLFANPTRHFADMHVILLHDTVTQEFAVFSDNQQARVWAALHPTYTPKRISLPNLMESVSSVAGQDED